MTNKKGDKKGEKRKQKGDKTDTITNKKGDKTDTMTNKKGDKTDTMTNKKGDKRKQKGQGGHSDPQEGRQDRRQRETEGTRWTQ